MNYEIGFHLFLAPFSTLMSNLIFDGGMEFGFSVYTCVATQLSLSYHDKIKSIFFQLDNFIGNSAEMSTIICDCLNQRIMEKLHHKSDL